MSDDLEEQKQIAAIVGKLYEAFLEFRRDALRDQPVDRHACCEVKALDSKFTVDDNALFRHPDIAEMRDPEADPPEERTAREKGVTYVKLDGSVGILANGAGLAMSTLDVVALAGGKAANFCDLGGGGDAQGVVDALEIITGDPQVRSVLFNGFGGITRTDEVARGILQALSQMAIEHLIVVARRHERGGGRLLKEAATDLTWSRRCWRRRSVQELAGCVSRSDRRPTAEPRASRGVDRRDRRVVGGPGDGSTSRRAAGTSRGGAQAGLDDGRPGAGWSRTSAPRRECP